MALATSAGAERCGSCPGQDGWSRRPASARHRRHWWALLAATATPALFAAVQAGRRSMSVEFTALDEIRTAGGVREIRRAMVSAAALTDRPDYCQTSAEVRERREARVWL